MGPTAGRLALLGCGVGPDREVTDYTEQYVEFRGKPYPVQLRR